MAISFKSVITLTYPACFLAYSIFLLADHKARFWIELDLAPFIPWLKSHPLVGLVGLLVFMGLGSYLDRLLQMDTAVKRPILGFFLALFVVLTGAFLFTLYLTNTYYTSAHDNFYITIVIMVLMSIFLGQWIKNRIG